jgi:phosphatidylglycerophosphate synthase
MLALILGDTGEPGDERMRLGPPLMVGGLSLVERAVLAAHRAGAGRSVVTGVQDVRGSMAARLRARGADVTFVEWGALQDLDLSDGALIIGPRVLVEPRALVALRDEARTSDDHTVLVAGGGAGDPALAVVPPEVCGVLVDAASSAEFMTRLAAMEPRREMSLTPFFCRRLESADDIAQAETDYIRHQNGRESFFTKKIRRFSVPLSRVLVRRGVGPNQVTLIGLLLGVGAAAAVSVGSYTASLAGALLYYASMIFDCSDGEVARLSFRDSVFGAWFETVVDYATYFLLLGGLMLGSQQRGGADLDLDAAIVALAGSLVVTAVAGYLRQRVSGNDPGQFDEASAAVLRKSTRFHRFARWGRQWIKRSTIAHLIVALALVNQLSILIYLWAFGAVVASVVIIGVVPFVVRQVKVAAPAVRA